MQNFVILTIYENACDTWSGLSDTNIYDWCVNHFSIILSNHMFRFKSLLWSRSVLVSAIELLKYSQNKINIDWRLPHLLWNQAPLSFFTATIITTLNTFFLTAQLTKIRETNYLNLFPPQINGSLPTMMMESLYGSCLMKNSKQWRK